MNNCKHDEHSTELASLDAQTADAPDPNRTAHHPVHLPRALYFEARGSTFLTFSLSDRGAGGGWRDARTTRPDAMARLQQLFLSDATL